MNTLGQWLRVNSRARERASGSSYTGTGYESSQLTNSEEEEDTGPESKLGGEYVQCRAAREVANTLTVVDISCTDNALSSQKKKGDRVGTLSKNYREEF